MKTTFKRIVCLLCAVCMVLALSACGGESETETTSSKNSGTTSSGSSEVIANKPTVQSDTIYADPNYNAYANIPESSKGVTVRYATWIDHWQTEGAVPLSNFYDDTGINVELYTFPQYRYVNALMTKMTAGDYPDVFISNEMDQSFPLTMQIAAPINKVSSVDLNDPIWDQSMVATGTIEGNVYLVNTIGSPWSGSNLVYFNKRLFSEYGFKSPADYYAEGTWTWDNMVKCMKDIKSLGEDYVGAYVEMDILCGAINTSFVKYDYKTHTFSSGIGDKALQDAYEWYADVRDQGLVGGAMETFSQGKCGISIRGVYGLKNTGYWKDMNPDDVGYTYLPSFEEGEKGLVSSIYGMHGIIEGAPNADAAGYFIRYWLDPDNYDLNHTFITADAGNFYYELINTVADEKHFCFDVPCAVLIGEGEKAFWQPALKANRAGVKSAIESVSNKVDLAVTEANALIKQKIDADRLKYK